MELHEDIISNLVVHSIQLRGRFAVTCKFYCNKLQSEIDNLFNILYPSINTAIIQYNIHAIRKLLNQGVPSISEIQRFFNGTDKAIDTYIFLIKEVNYLGNNKYWFYDQHEELRKLLFGIDSKVILPSLEAARRLIDVILDKRLSYTLLTTFNCKCEINEKFVTILTYFIRKMPVGRGGFKKINKRIKKLIKNPEIVDQIPGLSKLVDLLHDRQKPS